MQPCIRVRRALDDGLIEGAVVAVAMKRERDFVVIVLQSFKLSIPVGGHAVQLRAGLVAGAAIAHEIAAPQRAQSSCELSGGCPFGPNRER